ncbi:hypothetical protein BKA70DRAFT_1269124 [Coprinopsis sp. MPI-PUGE-AT-0042]|nr:hypothetical protein BKA70DRAFT_1269124 [Coprinopsis sp. MPI-PUGE-AT-0042]
MLPTTSFQDRLGTNYVPSQDETVAIQKLIEAVKPQIVSLDAEIEALKQRRAVFASFVADHRALISPIRHMPPDILRNIFSYCVPHDSPERIIQVSEGPLLLTQICRQWRDLTIKTPTLWSTIFLKIPEPPLGHPYQTILPCDAEEGGIDIEAEGASVALYASLIDAWRRKMDSRASLTNVWLSRAEGCPLTIFFRDMDLARHLQGWPVVDIDSFTKEPIERLLSLICARTSQWAQLDLRITESSLSEGRFLSQHPSRTPHLCSIHVKWSASHTLSTYSTPPSQDHNTPKSSADFHTFQATRLQHLSLDSFKGNFKSISVAWSNLTELSLASTGSPIQYYGSHSPSTDRAVSLPPSVALALLQDCTNLVRCELHLIGLTFNPNEPDDQMSVVGQIHLPRLIRLVAFEHKQSPCLSFFKSLCLPLLTSISWSSTNSVVYTPGFPDLTHQAQASPSHLSPYPLLATSGHQIEHLEFGVITVSVDQIFDTLKLAVGVKDLTIHISSVTFSTSSSSPWGATPPPFYGDELLDRLNPSSSSSASGTICPNLVILKLIVGQPSEITTKALKTLVANRGIADGHNGDERTHFSSTHVPLQHVLVRFTAPTAYGDIRVGTIPGGIIPKRWEEDQLNSGFSRRIIRVERRKSISHIAYNTEDVRKPFETYWDFESKLCERC